MSGINRKIAYKGMPKNGQNGLCTIARKDAYTGWPIRLVLHWSSMCCATYISIGCMHVVYIAAGSSTLGQWHKETSNDEGTG